MIKNKLPKVFCVIFATIICVLGVVTASADSNTVTLSDLNDMSVTLPSDVTAVTRSSTASDKYFSLFGIDYDTTMNNMKNSNIYLQGMDEDSDYTITITMTETTESQDMGNYNLLQSDKIGEVAANFLNQSEYTACTADTSGTIVWLYLETDVTSNNTQIKAYQANTVYDGKNINVTIQRNGSNATAEDYQTLSSVVSTISFQQADRSTMVMLIAIAGAVVLVIILIIFVVALVRHIKRKRKKQKNSRIIEELADKYKKPRNTTTYDDAEDVYDAELVGDMTDDEEDDEVDVNLSEYQSDVEDEEEYEDISTSGDGDFFEGTNYQDFAEVFDDNEVRYTEDEIDEILGYRTRQAEARQAQASVAEMIEAESVSEQAEEAEDEEPAFEAEQQAENEAVEEATQAQDEQEELDDEEESEEEIEEFEEYSNDEDLVRAEAKHAKFDSGYDFFDEAPKKTVGVISSEELEEAEDYDVINEVEQRVNEVEKPAQKSSQSFAKTMGKIGRGIKSFFVHCGYFFTNLSKMIKRNRAMKKRKKAEEERKRRAKQRAVRQRERQERENRGELIQVHKRGERPTSRSSRPSSTRNTRPSASNRSNATRRPTNSRPINKRR